MYSGILVLFKLWSFFSFGFNPTSLVRCVCVMCGWVLFIYVVCVMCEWVLFIYVMCDVWVGAVYLRYVCVMNVCVCT